MKQHAFVIRFAFFMGIICTQINPIHAAGFWNLERGASTLARGGAQFASAEDPSIMALNPALIASLPGLQVMLDANSIVDNRQFQRAGIDYQNVTNSHQPWLPSPGFFLSYSRPYHKYRWATGVAIYGPARVDHTWPSNGPQRYGEINYSPLQVHSSITTALELPVWKTRLGLTLMNTQQTIRNTMALNIPLGATDEDPYYDATVNINATQSFILGGILGVTTQPLPFLIVGAAYQPGYDVNASGKANIEMGQGLKGIASVQGNKANLKLKMPHVARLSVMYQDPQHRFDLELAGVYEGWGRSKHILFEPKNIQIDAITMPNAPLAPITLQTRFRDTFSIRLGSKIQMIPHRFALRAGLFYERAAVSKEWLNVASFDLDKVGLTAGGRVQLPFKTWLDVALGYGYWLSKTVNNSKVVQTNPLDPSTPQNVVIGNGKYKNTQIMALAAIGAQFDL